MHKIKDMESGKIKNMPVEIAALLEEKYNLNFRWVLTGQGEMLRNDAPPASCQSAPGYKSV
ncbi:hypothetical protein QUF80_15115 [Desulfococcaceae bacterium HSG8]|nr:hypothetical protein [Desulfococcaceae bacterium HSG8]